MRIECAVVAAVLLAPSLVAAQLVDRRACDVDGDGRDDLIVVARAGTAIRVQTGLFGPSEAVGYVGTAGWQLAGCGDLDGDGKDDLVYDGPEAIRIDLMDGVTVKSRGWIGNGGGAYRVGAIADTSADGREDLILTGVPGVRIDVMNGTTVVDRGWLPDPPSPFQNFHFVAAGDLNADGRADLVRDSNDSYTLYAEWWSLIGAQAHFGSSIPNGAGAFPLVAIAQVQPGGFPFFVADGVDYTRLGFRYLSTSGGAWRYRLLADLDGDAIDDLVSGGAVTVDFLRIALLADTITTANGPIAKQIGWIGTGAGAFELRQAGDFDGDGKSDLAFVSASTVRIDSMDGVAVVSRHYVAADGYDLPLLR